MHNIYIYIYVYVCLHICIHIIMYTRPARTHVNHTRRACTIHDIYHPFLGWSNSHLRALAILNRYNTRTRLQGWRPS